MTVTLTQMHSKATYIQYFKQENLNKKDFHKKDFHNCT